MMISAISTKLYRLQLPLILVFVQIVLFSATIFNIAFVRQVLGFLYISIFPGFIILKLLKLKLERVEQIIFAIGISIVFFMSIGLLINIIGPSLGISRPLDEIPLLVTTSIIMDFLAFYSLKTKSEHIENRVSVANHKNTKLILFAVFLCSLPLIAIVGALYVDVPPHSNNFVLILLFLFISVLAGAVAFSKRISSKFYVPILFVIALALVFHFSFFSNYLVGGDIFYEFSKYNQTLQSAYWAPQAIGRLSAMLSVTILPTIYSTVLEISGTWIYKIVYPLLFALIPLGLYQLFKSRVSEKIAFFSVFFFMSNFMFFVALVELPRQIIAELFFILLFLTIFKNNVQPSIKFLLFAIFSFGLIVSHYAIAYIFLGLIISFWLFYRIRKRTCVISTPMIVLFAAILFGWYIYSASGSTFGDLVATINSLGQNFFTDFFNPQARGTTVLSGLGAPAINTVLHVVGQYAYNLTELLIFIGILASFIKYKRKFFENKFNLLAFYSLLLLAVCIVVPNLAGTFNMERFYHVSLFFLAPFCLIGGISILSLLSRNKINPKYLGVFVVVALLIPVFLFQTGVIYEVAKEESYSLPLSSYRTDALTLAYSGVLQPDEVSAATWLSQNKNLARIAYTDLTSESLFYYTDVKNFSVYNPGMPIPSGSLIFIRQYTMTYGVVITYISAFNLTEAVPSFDTTNVIYSSGSCEINQVS